MFRGSSYSIETERDMSMSNINEESIKIALVGISEVGKSAIINCIEVPR
jgi:GTP-binding protein EngB required for normal cell division